MDNLGAMTDFRGFEKLPVVVVERIDIEPYVKKRPPQYLMKPGTSLDDITNKHHLRDCSIKVFRDDLEKIKMTLIEKPFVTCRICKKSYPDLKKLRIHQATQHMILHQPKVLKRVSFSDHVIVHELKEYHKCSKCSKIFENTKFLKLHMRKDHRKCYLCHYCQKSFVDRSLFKGHIKLHCYMCSQLFPSKADMVTHRKNVCKVFKKYKCKTCNNSFFQYMDLKDHSYDHFSTLYICDICKDQLSTKCAVSHHIAFLHSDKRPESLFECRNVNSVCLYSCNFCEETSLEKSVIENHVELLPDLSNRSMTGYKDFYFCSQCLAKFDNEMEMVQHKLNHNLKSDKNTAETSLSKVNDEEKSNKEMLTEINSTDETEKKDDLSILTSFDAKKKVPNSMLPVVLLKKLSPKAKKRERAVYISSVDIKKMSFGDYGGLLQKAKGKPIIDPKSKKTLLSRHQCNHCWKYLSSKRSLHRHLQSFHPAVNNLRCDDCEEHFIWPDLLRNHNCIRRALPEMEFQDARPEILIENPDFVNLMEESDDEEFMEVDYHIPPPIVELTEFDCSYVPGYGLYSNVKNKVCLPNGFRLIVEEVPVEF